MGNLGILFPKMSLCSQIKRVQTKNGNRNVTLEMLHDKSKFIRGVL